MHEGSIALAQVEANGIRIDTKYLDIAIRRTTNKIKHLSENLTHYKIYKRWKKKYGAKTNLGSHEQLAHILFTVMDYPCESFTKKEHKPAADEANLKSTKLKFVTEYLELEKLKKARSTYLRGILRETTNGYMHPNFPLHFVQSYRGSSRNPNFQNMPVRNPKIAKLVRQAFIPRENHHILEIDFKGAEICCSACYHEDPKMIKYIENPRLDMHRDMAGEIYLLRKKQIEKMVRFAAKSFFVFAEFYGDWYKNCAKSLWEGIDELSLKTTDGVPLRKHLRDSGISELGACDVDKQPEVGTFEAHLKRVEYDFWNKRFRVYNQWKKNWWEAYQEKGYFETLTGFTIAGNLDRKQAVNYPIQGSAFHWLLWSLTKLQKEMNRRKMKSLIIGQIHDSIVGDIHKSEVDEYLEIVREIIYEKIRKHWKWIIVPLTVEVEMAPLGKSWYEKEEVKIWTNN